MTTPTTEKNTAVQMLDLMSAFGSDSKLVNDGRWVGFPTEDSPYKFKIARLNNRGQRTMASKMMVENSAVFMQDQKDEAKQAETDAALEKLGIKVMASELLKGWTDNISLDGKTPLGAYTPEKAEQILTKFEDLRVWVEHRAMEFDAYKLKPEEEEQIAKN